MVHVESRNRNCNVRKISPTPASPLRVASRICSMYFDLGGASCDDSNQSMRVNKNDEKRGKAKRWTIDNGMNAPWFWWPLWPTSRSFASFSLNAPWKWRYPWRVGYRRCRAFKGTARLSAVRPRRNMFWMRWLNLSLSDEHNCHDRKLAVQGRSISGPLCLEGLRQEVDYDRSDYGEISTADGQIVSSNANSTCN